MSWMFFPEPDHGVIKDFMSRNGDTANHPQVHTHPSPMSSSSSMSITSSSKTSKSSQGPISSKVPSFDSISSLDSNFFGQQEQGKLKNFPSSADSPVNNKEVPPSTSTTAPATSSILKSLGCASPEVLVNGSPSPDILETVNGGKSGMGKIQEIQFVGVVDVEGKEKKRICKIKCLNGVWVGPLCTLEPGKCLHVNLCLL